MSFATFPEFTTLTYGHREEYERLIREYPPIADISFAGLMGWWGTLRPPKVSLLNGNIVIAYSSKSNGDLSEFCVIGTKDIDQSICAVYDYLINQDKKPELVHVPDFVVSSIRYPELFNFKAERAYDEYLIDLSRQQPLENTTGFQRHRLEQFLEKMQGHQVTVESLDMSRHESRKLLLDLNDQWPKRGINSTDAKEEVAVRRAIDNADKLGLHASCIKIDGVAHSYILFDAPYDQEYITLEYARLSYGINHIANFSIYMFSEWFASRGVKYANVSMDYGKPVLRIAKLALRPVNFFRKYSIEPQKHPATTGVNVSY